MHNSVQRSIEAIVVSGAWPGERTGYEIAVVAALREYSKFFSRVHFFGPAGEPFDDEKIWRDVAIDWRFLPLSGGPKWARFLRSLGSRLPAITVRFQVATRTFLEQATDIVRQAHARNATVAIIYEDVPAGCYLPFVRQRLPMVLQAVHSLNCLAKGFGGLEYQGGWMSRLAWRMELARIEQFERDVCEAADACWVITRQETAEYQTRLGIEPDGVVGISLDAERYRRVLPGDPATVVHVGSADLRKGKGLREFIATSWPLVRAAVPHARLVVGGRGTETFDNPSLGIAGLGCVCDDRDVLERGTVFVNPQEIGAGIKLKSVVAMLAGKGLVSTPTGIEGVEGTDGEHFFVEANFPALAARIIRLIQSPQLATAAGCHARALATYCYSQEYLSRMVQPLLARFVSGQAMKRRCAA